MAVMDVPGVDLVRALRWEPTDEGRQSLMWKEWLVGNGLGGYANGSITGSLTRRYHGLLVAALPTPFGRTVMFNYLWEQLRLPDGRILPLCEVMHTQSGDEFDASRYLTMFELRDGLPVWQYDVEGIRIEKRVL